MSVSAMKFTAYMKIAASGKYPSFDWFVCWNKRLYKKRDFSKSKYAKEGRWLFKIVSLFQWLRFLENSISPRLLRLDFASRFHWKNMISDRRKPHRPHYMDWCITLMPTQKNITRSFDGRKRIIWSCSSLWRLKLWTSCKMIIWRGTSLNNNARKNWRVWSEKWLPLTTTHKVCELMIEENGWLKLLMKIDVNEIALQSTQSMPINRLTCIYLG